MNTVYQLDPARLDRIKSWMQASVEERKYPGSSILIGRGGQEVMFHATGQRDIARSLPYGRDTLARIYSMTKPVTHRRIHDQAGQSHTHRHTQQC